LRNILNELRHQAPETDLGEALTQNLFEANAAFREINQATESTAFTASTVFVPAPSFKAETSNVPQDFLLSEISALARIIEGGLIFFKFFLESRKKAGSKAPKKINDSSSPKHASDKPSRSSKRS
jgi:hypothetical protein